MDDSDVDDFFDGVAGKPERGRPLSASQRLGATVRTALLKRREAADNTLSVADDIKRDALLNSLAERGLFRDPTPVKSTPPPRRRSTPPTFARWSRPLSLAAVLAMCAVGVVQLLPRSQVAPVVVERGPAALTVRSDDPAGSARELTRQVTQAGAEAQSVQINDSTWTVTIDLPRTASGTTDTDVRERVRRTLNLRGVKAPDADSFSVVVESTQHR